MVSILTMSLLSLTLLSCWIASCHGNIMKLETEKSVVDKIDLTCTRKLANIVLKVKGCLPQKIEFHKCQGACYTTWKPIITGIEGGDNGVDNNHCISCLPTKSFKKVVKLRCAEAYSFNAYQIIDTAEECQCRAMKCSKWGIHYIKEVLSSEWLNRTFHAKQEDIVLVVVRVG